MAAKKKKRSTIDHRDESTDTTPPRTNDDPSSSTERPDQIFENDKYIDKDFSRDVNYNEQLERVSFNRCKFTDLGLRYATISECRFVRCTFKSTYLRDAKFERSDLTGSEFYRCNLDKATFSNCKLWYVEFRECELNYDAILSDSVLPQEINQKRRLLRSLRINAYSMGERHIAERIHLLELKAERQESWEVFSGSSEYFRAKAGAYGKFKALCSWVWNHAENFVWGFGLRPGALVRTAALLILIFGTATFLLESTFFLPNGKIGDSTKLSFLDCIYVSTINFSTLGLGDYQPDSFSAKIICMLEGTTGAVFLGLLAASAYKKIVRK